MAYSNSPLAKYVRLSPCNSGQRTHTIDRISPHCVVGQCSIQSLGGWFSQASTKASANYGIDKDGNIGMFVEEKNRSWCTSSSVNDNRAITIECASDTTHPYAMHDVVFEKLVALCIDICKRNGKKKLIWWPDKNKSLNYNPAPTEMIITVHRWYANKACPGDWLYSRLGTLAARVNAALGSAMTTGSDELTDGSELKKPSTVATTSPATSTASHKTVRRGSEGMDVRVLQEILNKLGYTLVVDGIFGSKTYAAVTSFQVKHGLDVDGVVGPMTWKALESATSGAKKTNAELAKEVISGKWGNVPERKQRLEAAGYNFYDVQNEVNKLMKR